MQSQQATTMMEKSVKVDKIVMLHDYFKLHTVAS